MSNKIRPHTLVCVLLVLVAAFGLLSQKASAATITVTTTQDGTVGNVNGCSLREAVNAINTGSNGNGCNNFSNQGFGNSDTIRFANNVVNLTLLRPVNFLAAPTASLVIERPVTIRGNINPNTTISGGGGTHTLIDNRSNNLQLLFIRLQNAGSALRNMPDATARLVRVRVTGHSRRAVVNQGRMNMGAVLVADNPGGGIANANAIPLNIFGNFNLTCLIENTCPPGRAPSVLVIETSTIRNNGPVACAGVVNGGGVAGNAGNVLAPPEKLEGAIRIRRSRIAGNTAGNNTGGGICNQSTALIMQSEISGNRAGRGGGIAALGLQTFVAAPIPNPSTIITNSTISSNVASTAGGGVFVETGGGDLDIQFCTIAFNVSEGTGVAAAGGIASQSSPLAATFRFNALANNRSAANGMPVQDCANVTLNGNFNFWAVANTGTCSLSGQNNVTTGNALLGPLAINGMSPTRAHLPAAASALVDVIPAANPSCGGTDQRSSTRPREGNNNQPNGCDIGSVERP